MPALTADRNTPRRAGDQFSDPAAAGAVIHAGAMVVLNAAGEATPATTATGLVPRGVAEAAVDNTGGLAAAVVVASRNGVHRFINDASVTRADIGALAYMVDDQTVAQTNGGGTRSAAGTIVDVDADGVWVRID